MRPESLETVFFGSGYACATLLKPEILSIPLDPFSLGDNNVQEADGHTHLLNQIRELAKQPGMRVVLAASGQGSAQRMAETMRAENIELELHENGLYKGQVGGHVVAAPIQEGFIASDLSIAVLTERDITGRRRTHRPPRPVQGAQGAADPGRPLEGRDVAARAAERQRGRRREARARQ